MNDELDHLDRLIDDALASYTPQEPRAGLSQRILASVAADRPRTWGWRPVWAMAAAAALIVVVVIPLTHKSTSPTIAVLRAPQLAVVGETAAAAPAPVSYKRHPTASHLPVATGSAVPVIPVKSGTDIVAPLAITPIRNQPLADEALVMKPITIAPIQIAALN
jgi:hypothetical protein